jgi:c-di-GMP-binding flagellar brake protein YcgR
MEEKRRFIRIPERSPISYRVIPEPHIRHFLTRDISQGGVRFLVHGFIAKNNILQVRITFDKIDFSFETFVKRIWVRAQSKTNRYEIGAEFVNLSKQTGEFLLNYINSIFKHGQLCLTVNAPLPPHSQIEDKIKKFIIDSGS